LDKQEILAVFGRYCKGNEFELNPDKAQVAACIDGILENENKYGLKYCPCRIVSGDDQKDLELICPCNFTIQEKYKTQGECWCGLFVKRENK
jgi:ferredoxin-thioredoxin reductase catalytic chain